MAVSQLTRQQVLDKFASLSSDDKSILFESAMNYMFDFAMANHFDFAEISRQDILFKSLDFVAAGWSVENAMSSQWKYIG